MNSNQTTARTETKFTPGPWSVDRDYIGKMWTDSISVRDAETGHIAHLTRGYEGDANGEGCPSFANAALIAAAPELYAAAQAVVERWDTPLWKDVEPTARFIATLRAALAKARGEY